MQDARIMQSRTSVFFLNILLAVVIFYNAELGRLLGIQGEPLAISVVWPSSGFALAALLLFGLKTWPGIFLGNFSYNLLHLYLHDMAFLGPVLVATIISTGSLLQALLGNFIMHKFCSKKYFSTVKDVFIFLIPAGILTCFTASTIGVTTLYFYGTMTWKTAIYTWLTFWIGDTMGVYIFTPLLVVWSILKPELSIKKYIGEAFFMVIGFVLITFLIFIMGYPLTHLYIPLSIWVSYRLGMHGATLAVLLIALTVIILTSVGYGPFNTLILANSLLLLVSFLEIIVVISLVLAAVVHERKIAWNQIQNYNIDLQYAVEKRVEELEEMTNEAIIQKNLATSGVLTSSIARQIQAPLKQINALIKVSLEGLNQLQNAFIPLENRLEPELSSNFNANFESLKNYLLKINKCEIQANQITQIIEDQSLITARSRAKIRSINVNILLSQCLDKVIAQEMKRYPDFIFTGLEEFDKNVKMILVIPEELAHAFLSLINYAVDSMKEKKDRLGMSYTPILKISTVNLQDKIEVIIRDNGWGIPKENLTSFFTTFVESGPTSEEESLAENSTALMLALAHDIITHIYHGEIKVHSTEGEYLQFTLILPKEQSAP